MTNEEYEIAVARAEDFLDTLKDTCHDQYDKIKELEAKINLLEDNRMYLNNKIDKAITYIVKQTTDEETGKDLGYSDNIEYEYLLDILKGE